jgi:hypothetical protein
MSENFENELRRAMRPLEAPAGFAEKVMRALPERLPRSALEQQGPAAGRTVRRFGIPAAFAAAFVASILLGRHVAEVQEQRTARAEEAAGLAASHELMQALHVTSQKLDLAYQAVKTPPPPASDEENRT